MYAFLYVFLVFRQGKDLHPSNVYPFLHVNPPPPEKKKFQTNVTLTKTLPIVYTEGYFLTYYGI